MRKILRATAVAVFSLVLFLNSPGDSFAWRIEDGAIICDSINDVVKKGKPGLACLEGVIWKVLKGVLVLTILAFFGGLFIGGFKYLTVGGDEKALQSARNTITTAIAGLGLALAAYFLLDILGRSLKLPDLLRFELPTPSI